MTKRDIISVCLNNIENPAFISNAQGNIIYANDRFFEAFRLTSVVLGQTTNHLDFFPKHMHRQAMALMASNTDEATTLEYLKPTTHPKGALFRLQRKTIVNEDNNIVGLFSLIKPHDQKNQQLREILNVLYACQQKTQNTHHDDTLSPLFASNLDKLHTIIDQMPLDNCAHAIYNTNQTYWCNVLWVAAIDHPVIEQTDQGLRIDRLAPNLIGKLSDKKKISRQTYQIILIDANVLSVLPNCLDFIAENSFIACVSHDDTPCEDYALPVIDYYPEMADFKSQLFQAWKKHMEKETIKKVSTTGKLKVLSIEDDDGAQEALKQLLERHAFIEITQCASAKAVTETLLGHSFDLIVLDFGLPDAPNRSGYGTALLIREIQKQKGDFFCPIITNTGSEFDTTDDRLFHAGINEFYRKPELLKFLKDALVKYVPESFIITRN